MYASKNDNFIHVDAVLRFSENHISEYIKSKYDLYSKSVRELSIPDMGSQYTNAIYNVRDQIASRMNGPMLKVIKEAGGQSYQLVGYARLIY